MQGKQECNILYFNNIVIFHLLKGYDKEMYETKKENTKNLMKLLQQQNALLVECVGV